MSRALLPAFGATALVAATLAAASPASALTLSGPTAPGSIDLGTVELLESATRDVVVTATAGEGSVTFGSSTVSTATGAFSVDHETCSGTTVPDGGTCVVTVRFAPTAVGPDVATLDIAATDPAATVSVTLAGTGTRDATGTFYGMSPSRFLDTRTMGTKAPLGSASTTSVQITGRSGIPVTGVSAVVLNLTAVTTTASGYFTVYPSDRSRPTASSVNFPQGWTGANMVTVPVGADGRVKLYNHAGTAHAIVDVLGWYAADDSVRAAKGMGAQFIPTETGEPDRIYDSRDPGEGVFVSGDTLDLVDEWAGSEEAATIRGYAVNITAVGATRTGVLTAWAGAGSTKPTASTVNYEPGVTAPNMAVVPAGRYSETETGFRIQNTAGTVHVVVDLVGYYVADDTVGLRFTPAAPKRVLDTRNGTGLSGAFGAGVTRRLNVDAVTSLDSYVVVGNTTGVQPTLSTFLTVWSGASSRPSASTLNVSPGRVRSVSTYAPLAIDEADSLWFSIYNRAGSMHVLMDAAGTFDIHPSESAAGGGSVAATDARAGARTSGETSFGGRGLADPSLPAPAAPGGRTSTRG